MAKVKPQAIVKTTHVNSQTRPNEERHAVEISHDLSLYELTPTEFRRRLQDALATALPSPVLSDSLTSSKAIFAAYVENLKRLATCQSEMRHLLLVMSEQNVEFASGEELRDEVRQQMSSEIAKDYSLTFSPALNAATAELAAQPIDTIRNSLNQAIKKSIEKAVDELIAGFDLLVERKVVGLVHWTGQNTVRYDFYKRIFHVGDYQVSDSLGSLTRATEGWRRWKRVQTRHEVVGVTCTIKRHKHEAIDAFQTSLENSRVIMPPEVIAICEAIPPWLRSEITVLDGYLIHQPTYEEVVHRGSVERVTETDIPVYGHEPGVVCGFYVLTGWGPAEIEAENNRRLSQHTQVIDPVWPSCFGALQVFTVMFALWSMPRLAMLSFCVSTVCLLLFVRQLHRCVKHILPNWQTASFFVTFSLCLAGFHLSLGAASFQTAAAGALLSAGCLLVLCVQRDYPIRLMKLLKKGN